MDQFVFVLPPSFRRGFIENQNKNKKNIVSTRLLGKISDVIRILASLAIYSLPMNTDTLLQE